MSSSVSCHTLSTRLLGDSIVAFISYYDDDDDNVDDDVDDVDDGSDVDDGNDDDENDDGIDNDCNILSTFSMTLSVRNLLKYAMALALLPRSRSGYFLAILASILLQLL